MPPLEAPHGPARKVRRKRTPDTSARLPHGGAGSQTRSKPAPRPKPAPPPKYTPTRTQTRSARAQEQGYRSQGKAVRKVAKRQQTTARAKSTERGYRSQGRQVEKSANTQKRAQRLRYLRKHRTTGIKFITHLSSEIAHGVAHNAVITGTGGGPNFTKLAPHGKGGGIATALAPHGAPVKSSKVATHFVQDLLNLPAQSVATGYDLGAAGFEAAHGDTKRAKRIVKSVKQSDPIYNTVAAGVEAVKGNKKSAKEHLERTKKSVTEHPGFALAEVYGAKGTAGRALGRAGRAGALGKTVKQAASTERAARTVEHTPIREPREHSKDVLRKGRQVATEKVRKTVARKIEQHARHKPAERAEELRHTAAKVRGDRVPEREIQRQVDEHVAAQEDVRRIHRARVVKKTQKATKGASHATVVVAQRITRAGPKDIRAYIDELKAEYPTLSKAGQRANRELRTGLEKALKSGDMHAVERQAQAYREIVQPLQRKLVKRGLLAKGQEEKARLIPYAVRRMGATHDEEKGLVSERKVVRVRNGKRTVTTEKTPLRAESIRNRMRQQGETEPAFVTQAPNQRGARNFNVRSERPVTVTGPKRTGEATRKGTFDANPEVLTEQAARTQGLVDATDGFRSFVKRFAHRNESDKVKTFKTRKQAETYAKEHVLLEDGSKRPGAVALRPVRVNPWGATNEQLRNLIEEADTPEAHQAITEAMHDALEGKPGPGKWALVPEAAAKRMQDHLNVQGGGGGLKTVQLANQAFRKTVLSTSTSWFAGNMIEGLGRAALAKAGPRSYLTGHRALKRLGEIDPKKVEEAAVRMVGGGHFSSASRLHMRRGAEQFEYTKLAPIATALGKFWRLPGPKQAANLWNHYTDWVFSTVNGRIESSIQTAMLGKALRESPLMDGHLLKAGKGAINDAAKGLRNTDNQIAFGRAVDRMYGRYSKFSPPMRKAIATYTPFVAWALNAAYFVYRTMPRDHPTTTAVIAAAENANQEWRKQHGLDKFISGALPGFLQGSIPLKGGGHLRISRYTPFGAFSDTGDTIAGQFNPLFSGVLAALRGQDWKGAELRVKGADGKSRPANELERFVFAARAMAESTVPAVSQAENLASKGPNALNPLRPVAPKKVVRSTSSSSGKFNFTGSGGGFNFTGKP